MDMKWFQHRVDDWMMKCFGKTITYSNHERNLRFGEEALELLQSCGMTKIDVLKLVDYVYSRPMGITSQEIGGVMVCLSALSTAHNIDLENASKNELDRIWLNIDKIRAKHDAKTLRIADRATPE